MGHGSVGEMQYSGLLLSDLSAVVPIMQAGLSNLKTFFLSKKVSVAAKLTCNVETTRKTFWEGMTIFQVVTKG